MTNEEAAMERDRARQESSERASRERNQSTKDRAKEINERNSERKQQRDSAANILTAGSANSKISEIARLGGSVGRKLEREIRQFQQTGKVSSWLAGETIKSEAAQNAAQQSAFRQQFIDAISNPLAPIQVGPLNSYTPELSKKPEIQQEGGAGGEAVRFQPWDIYVIESDNTGYKLGVRAGTLNNFLPTNWDGEFNINNNNLLFYAKAVIRTDGQDITGVNIVINTTPPILQTPEEFGVDDTVDYLFGLFLKGTAYRVIRDGHIDISPKLWLTIKKQTPPVAGELPFVQFFSLR
jgi:hypothetical protein